MEVRPGRYRVPDIAIIPIDRERTPILTEPPLIVIEIMSPADRAADLQDRCLEYIHMGVKKLWVFDLVKRRTWDVDAQAWHAVDSANDQAVLGLGAIRLSPKEIFELNSK